MSSSTLPTAPTGQTQHVTDSPENIDTASINFSAPEVVCDVCGFDVRMPVGKLRTSMLGFYPDARFPGRCLLVVEGFHAPTVEDLPPDMARVFMSDILTASRILREATDCDRVNFAVLGNTIHHVHAHLIPRYDKHDPNPDRPPWEDPREQTMLPEADITFWRSRLETALKLLSPQKPPAYVPRPKP